MDEQEYTRAVRRARRVFCLINIVNERKHPIRISKAKALEVLHARSIPEYEDVVVNAQWLDDEHRLLMIG